MKKEALFLIALMIALMIAAFSCTSQQQPSAYTEDDDVHDVLDMNYDERIKHIRYLSDELRKLRGYVYSDPSGYGYLNRILYIQTEIQLFQYANYFRVHHGERGEQ